MMNMIQRHPKKSMTLSYVLGIAFMAAVDLGYLDQNAFERGRATYSAKVKPIATELVTQYNSGQEIDPETLQKLVDAANGK